ncbi:MULTISPECIES: DUF6714 family protein [Rhodopirellula]|uniref:DUF6714 family protein n=1 Tax=Rhodopirellula TaxID=265488 RepID=UPI00257B464B|nr:DUF6714 family protein [Rhodopirellula sp. UBA1907]|tara:strand:+ start:471 stop:959 length:489 start_codon:yes stop_codon:yes gene_type:complete
MQTLRIWLADYIEHAFRRATLGDGTSIYRAESIDDYGNPLEDELDQTAERIDWRRVPNADLLKRNWALHHLDAKGFRFYTPAILTMMIDPQNRSSMLMDTFLFRLIRVNCDCMIGNECFHSIFNASQRAAIIRFLKFAQHNEPRGFNDVDVRRALEVVKRCS